MPTNSLRFEHGRVIKRYTHNGDFITLLGSMEGRVRYAGRRERFWRELDCLSRYSSAGLPVPEYLGSDLGRLEISMERIGAQSFLQLLLNKELTASKALGYLSRTAEALRLIHQHGEHGDPYLSNFLVGNSRLTVIDFEYSPKNGKHGDLSMLFASAIADIAAPEAEIRKAIADGYGQEPDAVPYLWKVTAKAGNYLHRTK